VRHGCGVTFVAQDIRQTPGCIEIAAPRQGSDSDVQKPGVRRANGQDSGDPRTSEGQWVVPRLRAAETALLQERVGDTKAVADWSEADGSDRMVDTTKTGLEVQSVRHQSRIMMVDREKLIPTPPTMDQALPDEAKWEMSRELPQCLWRSSPVFRSEADLVRAEDSGGTPEGSVGCSRSRPLPEPPPARVHKIPTGRSDPCEDRIHPVSTIQTRPTCHQSKRNHTRTTSRSTRRHRNPSCISCVDGLRLQRGGVYHRVPFFVIC